MTGRNRTFYSIIFAIVVSVLSVPVYSIDLSGTYISLGINSDGSLVNDAKTLAATFPDFPAIEFFLAGTPFEGWAVGVDGSTYLGNFAPASAPQIPVVVTETSTAATKSVLVTGTADFGGGRVLGINRTIEFGLQDTFVKFTIELTNTGTATLNRVAFLEGADPDQGWDLGSFVYTFNDVVYNKRFVRAWAFGGSFPQGLTVGLAGADARPIVSVEFPWQMNPYNIIDSPEDPDGARNDAEISIAYDFGTLAPGQSARAEYYMIFGTSIYDADVKFEDLALPCSVSVSAKEPPEDFYSSAIKGGAFTPLAKSYLLTNRGSGTLVWSANKTQPWLDIIPPSGSLAASQSTIVNITINDVAYSLSRGIYSDTVTFIDTNGNCSRKRDIHLSVLMDNQYKLLAADGSAGDNFGSTCAVNGDYCIIGSFGDDDGGINSGSAYIYKLQGGGWLQQDKLNAQDAAIGDNFGFSVALDGNFAVVGSPLDDVNGINSGSAYIFERQGAGWIQQAKLTAPDASAGDSFGRFVSINGDFAIIGTPYDDEKFSDSGSAYIFKKEPAGWVLQGKLTASDAAAGDNFGWSVSIGQDYAIIGAYNDDDQGTNSGSAYVFKRQGSSWVQQVKLTALDGAAGKNFGYSVSIDGDYAITGSYGDYDYGNSSGAAYIFKREIAGWVQQAKLNAADPAAGDNFGWSVAIDGDFAVVGSPLKDNNSADSGSAYLFRREGINWLAVQKFTASDASASDNFGSAVSIDNGFVLTGAFRDDDKGIDSGSAYTYGQKEPLSITAVSGPQNFDSVGFQAGPFEPNVKQYILANVGPNSLQWSISSTADWLQAEPNSGTLNPGANQIISVYLNQNAYSLEPGIYNGAIIIRNLTSGTINGVFARITVRHIPGKITITDSIAPVEDSNLPFGDVIFGLKRTEHITLTNTDSNNYVLVDLLDGMLPFSSFSEQFPSLSFDPLKWTGFSGRPVISDGGIGEPSPPFSLRLNGHPEGGDAIESRIFDLSGISGVQVKYWYQRGGIGDPPELGDDLIIEYWNGYKWIELHRQFGAGPVMSNYAQSVIGLPPEAFSANFRLRIRSIGAINPDIEYDDWFVDDISIEASGSALSGSGTKTNSSSQSNSNVKSLSYLLPVGSGFTILNVPTDLPAKIEPLGNLTFDVEFQPVGVGIYDSNFVIYSDDSNTRQVSIKLSGKGMPDYIEVIPEGGAEFLGHPGGPFIPANFSYTLSNTSIFDVNWSIDANVPWLDINPKAGLIPAGQSTVVVFTPNSQAELLVKGDYYADCIIANLTTGKNYERQAHLNIFTEPKLWLQPRSLNVTLTEGVKKIQTLNIANTGDAPLKFGIGARQTSFVPFGSQTAAQSAQLTPEQMLESVLKAISGGRASSENFLVRFKTEPNGKGKSLKERNETLGKLDAGEVLKDYKTVPGLSKVRLKKGKSLSYAIQSLIGSGEIIYVEPDYIVSVSADNLKIPNDPYFALQWNMHNTGQSGGLEDADIDAPEAWFVSPLADSNIIVAVIDTGVDYRHEDLASKIWINRAEYYGISGIDDDGNGYIDDVYGYDFSSIGKTRDSDPLDDHGHGTHVSGIIGAASGNFKGVSGVAEGVKLMALKFLNSEGTGYESDAIDAIEYAVMMGAEITNNSWGGGGYSQALRDAIDASDQAGILFAVAAGNNATNNDHEPFYPSSYDISNIISVLATNRLDERSVYSNFGAASVDIGAPGGDFFAPIYSCDKNNSYSLKAGTSMACPHVAGAAALVWSINPSMSHLEVKNLLMSTSDKLPALSGWCASGGRLNLYNAALQAISESRPPFFGISPRAGILAPGDSNIIKVTFDANLSPGTYNGNITVKSNDPCEGKVNIPFTMLVEPVDYLAEIFEPNAIFDVNDPNAFDLSFKTVTFRPAADASYYYKACIVPAAEFPVDPAGGTVYSLGDDDYATVTIQNNYIDFFETRFQTFYIGSNGYITLRSGDVEKIESLTQHFALPRISALFDDLDPSAGGTISSKQLSDRIAVTFENVPEYSLTGSNSFQIEMFFNGVIRITWLGIDARDGLVGLSKGEGLPRKFYESSFSNRPGCSLAADFNKDFLINFEDFTVLASQWLTTYDTGIQPVLLDQFNSVSYSNSDGNKPWLTDWLEFGESDGPNHGIFQVEVDGGISALRLGSKSNKPIPYLTLTRGADINEASRATLSFDYRCVNVKNSGSVYCWISRDSGTTQHLLATYNYNGGSGHSVFDITDYISADTRIMFQTSSTLDMYLYIDNVRIEHDRTPLYINCDLNFDAIIDARDLIIFIDNFLK